MSIVTLEEVKQHLRVSFDDDDAIIAAYISAAEKHVEAYLNRPLQPWNADDDAIPVPDDVRIAILLEVGGLYENRESVSQNANYFLNPAFTRLLCLYRQDMGI